MELLDAGIEQAHIISVLRERVAHLQKQAAKWEAQVGILANRIAQLEAAIRSLVGAGELDEGGWLVFGGWNDGRMYPPDDPYTIAYKALGDE